MLYEKGRGAVPYNRRKAIAEATGVGDRTAHKYMKVVGRGAPELVEQMRKGEVKIGTAYGTLQAVTKTVAVIFDDTVGDGGSGFCFDNVVGFIGEIEGGYGDLEGIVGMTRIGAELEKAKMILEKQRDALFKHCTRDAF